MCNTLFLARSKRTTVVGVIRHPHDVIECLIRSDVGKRRTLSDSPHSLLSGTLHTNVSHGLTGLRSARFDHMPCLGEVARQFRGIATTWKTQYSTSSHCLRRGLARIHIICGRCHLAEVKTTAAKSDWVCHKGGFSRERGETPYTRGRHTYLGPEGCRRFMLVSVLLATC